MLILAFLVILMLIFLLGRVVFIMMIRGKEYEKNARIVQERERCVRASRGLIFDRNGVVLASNRPVCTISVIHNQISDEEQTALFLSEELELDYEKVLSLVQKKSSIEIIQRNVAEEKGKKILEANISGIKVDMEYKRYYPYGTLASKVLGFAGGDNQGILGIEAKYDELLTGENGTIYTLTDGRGVDVKGLKKTLKAPIPGQNIYLTLDYEIQKVCHDMAENAYIEHEAQSVSIIAMNPQDGAVYAMVDYPEYDLNHPFSSLDNSPVDANALNAMWRNACLNDTYEPGSIFKIITASIALEEQLVDRKENFSCGGSITVDGVKIHCHKTIGHGPETFETALMNSCNPVFIQIGLRIGTEKFYSYMDKFGMFQKTGIDLAGEAGTIMHKKENVHNVELATISFGQSFQVTPIQMACTISSLINGGIRIRPHLLLDGTKKEEGNRIISEETSKTMRELLHNVVAIGSGKNGKVEGYEVGGKTATSQTLPRSAHKYIASFVCFYPVENPKILLLVIINDPKGAYYGGTIAAPLASQIFEKVLPYLDKNG